MVETIGDLLRKQAEAFPDRLAVKFGEREITYRELDEMVDRLAYTLFRMGVRKGDKVGLWMQNIPEWVVGWFAVPRIGGVVVPMDTWYKPSEAEYILQHSESVAVITSDRHGKIEFTKMLEDIKGNLPDLKNAIVVGETPDWATSFEDALKMGEGYAEDEAYAQRQRELDLDDVTFTLYTSGTTGKPKGAMLTHYNIVQNALDTATNLRATEEDRYLVQVPFSHCFGCVLGITAAVTRASAVIPLPVFTPENSLKAIQDNRASIVHGVPTMFIRMLEILDSVDYDMSSMRTGIMAGAPCPVDVVKAVKSEMNMDVLIAYGLTEASPVITMTTFDDSDELKAETVGRTIPGVCVKIVDEDRKEVPIGEMGELACRGYNVMKGYYKRPDATAETIDEEGWLYTGDLATVDKYGYVKIVGRKKEMIIVGGFNVYPREIEEFLREFDKIQDIAIAAVPDRELGEVVGAAVIPKEGVSIDPVEIVDFCYGKIASAKVPRYVIIVDELPISGRGKVQKFRLTQIFKEKLENGEIEKLTPTAIKNRKK